MGCPVRLQSEKLHVDVLPDNGGRVASIRCRRTETEFLLSGSKYGATAAFSDTAPFEVSDCAGWDECLPTVSFSFSESGEYDAPDHGDLWRRPWITLEQSEAHIVLSTECFSRSFSFTRSLHVEATRIRFDYSVANRGHKAESFLYACHPLFAVDAGDGVLLPREISTVRLHYSRGNRIGLPGEQIPWPLTVPGCEKSAINLVGDVLDSTAEMFYVTSLRRGICALYRAHRNQAVVMRFTLESLPFLGLWICSGGWPEQDGLRKQHAVALEPTVAPSGSLADAVAVNSAPLLQPGAEYKFSVEVEILGCDQPCTYEEVNAILDITQLIQSDTCAQRKAS